MDVTEEGKHYIVEAELPGVKKENIEVRIGDGGRSITIEGKIVDRRGEAPVVEAKPQEDSTAAVEGATTTEAEGEPVASFREGLQQLIQNLQGLPPL